MSDISKININVSSSSKLSENLQTKNIVASNVVGISQTEHINLDTENNVLNELISYHEEVACTSIVGFTSIASGVLKVGEYLSDGGVWILGTSISAILDLLGEEEYSKLIQESIKGEISRDKVQELNKIFYEQTNIGSYIDDKSLLKYDGKVANTIQDVSTFASEIILATAATCATGGTLVPIFAVGFVEGVGKSGEESYSNPQNSGNQTGTILIDGVLNGTSFVAMGSTGRTALEGIRKLQKVTPNIAKNLAGDIGKEVAEDAAISGISYTINEIQDVINNK